MKILLFLALIGAVVIIPFRMIKAQWAERLWKRIRLIFLIYVLVIFISAVVRLAANGGDFNWQF